MSNDLATKTPWWRDTTPWPWWKAVLLGMVVGVVVFLVQHYGVL